MALKAIAGGLLSGLGQGMVAQDEVRRRAEERRQEALRRARERQEDRDFQVQRDEAQRVFQTGLEDRRFKNQQTLEGQRAARDAQTITSTITGEDGSVYGITKTGGRIDLGIKAPPKGSGSGSAPAEVQSAEWLARHMAASEGREPTAQDMVEAHRQIRTAKDNPNQRAGLVVRLYEAAKKDFRDRRSDEEKFAAAETAVDQLLAKEGGSSGSSRGGSGRGSGGGGLMPGQGGQSASSAYKSADDVKSAYQAGTLSRAEALNILRSQFGYK